MAVATVAIFQAPISKIYERYDEHLSRNTAGELKQEGSLNIKAARLGW